MSIALFFLYVVFSFSVVYAALPAVVWEVGSAVYILGAGLLGVLSGLPALILMAAVVTISLINRVEAVRVLLSDFIFKRAIKVVPNLSKTEAEALNAGDVWLEKSIFMGEPDWDQLATIKTTLSDEEQSFLDNEVTTLCGMLNDWEILSERDIPQAVWRYLKDKGFFGLVIDKAYGGKGFSARAHSDIVAKIAVRSASVAVTVMVPNSLGPGELLHFYGTAQQKKHYLPRLASGEDIPCFALTEPGAGSDATSIQSEAIVVERNVKGKTELSLELTLDKRWITLSPVATLIGLAVQLKDPKGLLKGKGEEGITCVLIPRDTKNLIIGNRHLPAGQAFMNGTIRGKNIVVPISQIIGGQERAGQGWQMLVECLSIGRSISLPALAGASAGVSYLTAGAFSKLRRQFNVDIAQFEGIQEKLAEIAGLSYLITATRLQTLAAVNTGKKPAAASAITKCYTTELARITTNAAMDIHAGRTVVLGPRNYLASMYQALPIMITVEGANILTRNLLIFGQGSMACHPYIRDEFDAIVRQDKQAFGNLLWSHTHYFVRNLAKTVCTMLTGGRFISVPGGALKREHQQLSRLSYAYAWFADMALIVLGGGLKRRERLSARLADGMAHLYMAMAVLRHADEHRDQEDHLVHAKWATQYCFYQAQKAMIEFSHNLPNKLLGMAMRRIAFPFGQTMRYPDDQLDRKLASVMSSNNDYRDSLLQSTGVSEDSKQPIGQIENALQLVLKHSDLYGKIRDLRRCQLNELEDRLQEKVKQNELTREEMKAILMTETARWDAMQVDEFEPGALNKKTKAPAKSKTS